MLAAEDGLLQAICELEKGGRDGPAEPCTNSLGGMALSTVLLNNCSNEVLLLMNAVTPLEFVLGIYDFESNLTCHLHWTICIGDFSARVIY